MRRTYDFEVAIKLPAKPLMIAAAGAAVLSVGAYAWKEEHRPQVLEIHVFSLRGGRSMFVRTPEDRRVLIDGGGNAEIVRQISGILPFYSRHLDAIISTTGEGKNVSGLIDILERYEVDRAYIPAVTLRSLKLSTTTDAVYETFLRTLKTKKVSTQELKAGMQIKLDEKSIASVLFPADEKDFSYSKNSPPEIMFKLGYGSTSIAFLGNASTKIQRYVASSSRQSVENADVLIVSHGASPSNMALAMLKTVSPRFLVYSRAVPQRSTAEKAGDALSVIPPDGRFNVRSAGGVKIISDGNKVEIKNAR